MKITKQKHTHKKITREISQLFSSNIKIRNSFAASLVPPRQMFTLKTKNKQQKKKKDLFTQGVEYERRIGAE